jgi:uncharacterized protein YndB with AHSA1/START domain
VADGDAVIRGALRLALVGAGIGYALDRILSGHAAGADPDAIESMIVIDAPIERVWKDVADVIGQPRWMLEMKAVRLLTPGPVGVGTKGEADVRVLGISVTDPVTITEFEPPHRFGISHEGSFGGRGRITLEAGADGTTTIVRWTEVLIPPVFPHLGALVISPALGAIFQADLVRLKEIVETSPGPTS